MSYILDALKKAEAERERSAVPGLHAQAGFDGDADAPRGWRGPLVAVAGALLAAAAVAVWMGWGRSEPAAPLAAAPTPVPAPAFAPAPAPAPAPATPALATPPTPAPAPPAVATAPPPPLTAAPAAPAPTRAAVTRPAAAAKAPPAVAAPAASNAEARLPSRNELSPELRAALPALVVSGAVYAPKPSGRMLFVNGLVLREGDAIAEGLTVERIGASASVLAFRGQRFELRH